MATTDERLTAVEKKLDAVLGDIQLVRNRAEDSRELEERVDRLLKAISLKFGLGV